MGTIISDRETKDFDEFLKQYSKKKMKKLEKKLRRYAEMYYGAPVAIQYLLPGVYAKEAERIRGNEEK